MICCKIKKNFLIPLLIDKSLGFKQLKIKNILEGHDVINTANALRLMGVEIDPITTNKKTNVTDRVQLLNADVQTLSLVPFFVLPGEFFRQDTASKAKLMVYEQNTGKRIIFFSPESLSDETSGIVLERLNFLLSDKDMEAPFDEETLTSDTLKSIISNKRNRKNYPK